MLTLLFSPNFRALGLLIVAFSIFCSASATQFSLNISTRFIETDEYKIHFAQSGNVKQPGIIFIHGTPGDWTAFKFYLENKYLQENYLMISVDRLGWGKSKMRSWKIDGDFAHQAEPIGHILQLYPDKKWLIVGHSLGASIAPKVALQSPLSVSGLLLLAGSLDPKLGKPRWYNRFANTLLARWLLPSKLQNSNKEIMALQKELTIMNKKIMTTKLEANLVIMQGSKDNLVSPKNPSFAKNNWQSHFGELTVLELPKEGHFLPWKQTELVIEQFKKLTN